MERVEELLRSLEKEVVEARNQTIKTDNSLRNLVGDVKAISRRQEAYESRLAINSVGAYVIFATLAFVGLLLFFRASIARAQLDRDLVTQQQEEFEGRIAELESELERRRAAETEAYEFYELLSSGRRDEIVERFPTVQGRLIDRATIELFRREVERIRHELAVESYELGSRHYEDEAWQEARDALLRSMAFVELSPYSPDLHFKLGQALFELDDFAGAARYFELAIESDALGRDESIIAMFRIGDALRRLDRLREALDAYRAFLRRYDSHRWAGTARDRAASIERSLDSD